MLSAIYPILVVRLNTSIENQDMKSTLLTILITSILSFNSTCQKDTISFGASGDKYIGDVNKSGLPHGHGESISSFGGGYIGQWKNGVYHGYGTKTWHNGNAYAGSWKLGNRNGHGRMSWEVNFYYEGQWKNNNQHGSGIIVYPKGNSRTGKWIHGLMHGKGKYQSEKDGKSHEDQYWHGRMIEQSVTYY